jgi:hypothetical protein
MATYLQTSRRKTGLPEFLLVCAIVMAVAPLTFVWISLNQPEWPAAGGWVLSGEIVTTHYNAPDYKEKVTVNYEYLVGGANYRGEFVGLWPDVGSPNALLPDELERITRKGHPLTVFYDPTDPARSRLHSRGHDNQLSLILIAGCCVVLAGAYAFVAYPALRRR